MYTYDDKKETVKLIQRYVGELLGRRDVRESGVYDSRTREAVMEYQQKSGLDANGVVNGEVFEKMYTDWLEKTESSHFESYSKGDYSPRVREIKSLFKRLWKYYPDTDGFDDNNMFGEDLESEIKRIREIMGLDDSPEFDAKLYDRIIKELKIREKSR